MSLKSKLVILDSVKKTYNSKSEFLKISELKHNGVKFRDLSGVSKKTNKAYHLIVLAWVDVEDKCEYEVTIDIKNLNYQRDFIRIGTEYTNKEGKVITNMYNISDSQDYSKKMQISGSLLVSTLKTVRNA